MSLRVHMEAAAMGGNWSTKRQQRNTPKDIETQESVTHVGRPTSLAVDGARRDIKVQHTTIAEAESLI